MSLNTIYSNDFINKIKINIHRHKRYKYVKNFNSLQIHNPNDPFLRSIIQERMNSDPLSLSYKNLDEYIEDKYKYLGSQSLYSSLEEKPKFTDIAITNKQKIIKLGALEFSNIPYEQLFDLDIDPYEKNDLLKTKYYTWVKIELNKELIKWMKTQDDYL